MSTTLLNAYLEPILVRYAGDLASGLDRAGVTSNQKFLMQSNGGVMPLAATAGGGRTVHTLLSGPAAGVQGAGHLLGRRQGHANLVTMDMGGTSCDIAFIQDGIPREATEGKIGGRDLDVPALDVTTISAGGGTVARLDAAAYLNVGPDSAGAVPGPACYGRGGHRPTVTDADLLAGFLNPDHFLGGSQPLDPSAALGAIRHDIAEPMGITPDEAAAGIIRLINARMADEIRVRAAKKVVDLSDAVLVPFGGAGPAHAAMVAEELGMARVLIPPNPGAYSALGLLCADIIHDYVRSDLRPLEALAADDAEACFAALEDWARADLAAEGLAGSEPIFVRELDLRYAGQGCELRTDFEGIEVRPLTAACLSQLRDRFDMLHEMFHGHAARESAVEVVSYRVRARVAVAKQEPKMVGVRDSPITTPVFGVREISFDGRTRAQTPVYRRGDIAPEIGFDGPAIVEQFDATTVVPGGWRAQIDGYDNLILERRG